MSYYVQIDDSFDQFASNSGYSDVVKWVQKLPADQYAELRHLVRYGWENDVPAVQSQLETAIKAVPPKGHNMTTCQGLLDLIKHHKDGAVISITDGMGKGDSSDEK